MTEETSGRAADGGRSSDDDGRLTRRSAIGAGGALAVAGAGLLAGCGSSTSTSPSASGSTSTSKSAGKPVHGGTLTIGANSGTADNLSPSSMSDGDQMRSRTMYELLFAQDASGIIPILAKSAEPNADASVWTLQLRDGVTFHNGKPMTADDVVWTLKQWALKDSPTFGSQVGIIDFKGVRKRGPLTVEVPLATPLAQFPAFLTAQPTYCIVPNGMTIADLSKTPIGTGAWKFVSHVKNQQTTLAANPDHWSGRPYADKLVINTTFTDDPSRVNALLSGQINLIYQLPTTQAKQYANTGQMQVSLSKTDTTAIWFGIDITAHGFQDPRVRHALMYATDRQAMVEGALAGFGTISSDMMGAGNEFYDASLVRGHDPEQAKSLLKAAGAENLAFPLPTASNLGGGTEAAVLWQEQLGQVGVKVNLNVMSPANYYGAKWPYTPVTQDYTTTIGPSLTSWYRTLFTTYDYTRWGGTDKMMNAAMAAVDKTKAEQLWHQVQETQFQKGGFIFPMHFDVIDGAANNIKNLESPGVDYFNGLRSLQTVWIAA
jgi:peptide/nickel transport system substrate-binding protein